MELLLDHPAGLQQTEIAAKLRCSKTSVYRISMTLMDYGYLVRDEETKVVRLSRKLVAMGSRTLTEGDLMTVSVDIMKGLRDKVRETVLIGTIVETELVVLGQVLGAHPFKFSVDLGARLPLHTAAPGKAILAFLPDTEREAILGKICFIRFNERTVRDVREYRRQLEQAALTGYALDLGEQLAGIHCVAAPVFNRHGYPVASVWTTGPTERMPRADLPSVGAMVREQARLISGRLGYGVLDQNGNERKL
jgi:DNA-binding IclR family transcriptional regulator